MISSVPSVARYKRRSDSKASIASPEKAPSTAKLSTSVSPPSFPAAALHLAASPPSGSVSADKPSAVPLAPPSSSFASTLSNSSFSSGLSLFQHAEEPTPLPLEHQQEILATVLKLDPEGRTPLHNLAASGLYDDLVVLLDQLKRCTSINMASLPADLSSAPLTSPSASSSFPSVLSSLLSPLTSLSSSSSTSSVSSILESNPPNNTIINNNNPSIPNNNDDANNNSASTLLAPSTSNSNISSSSSSSSTSTTSTSSSSSSTTSTSTPSSSTSASSTSSTTSTTSPVSVVAWVLELKDTKGWTALHVASYSRHYKICLLFLQHESVNVNAVTAEGSTLLHYLSRRAPPKEEKALFLKLLTTLLRKGADVDLVTQQGESALHSASLGGNFQAVRFLTLNGSMPNLKSQMGMTPLLYAIQTHHEKIVDFLVDWVDPRIGDCLALARQFKFSPAILAHLEKRTQQLVAQELAPIEPAPDSSEASVKFDSRGFSLQHPGETIIATFICAAHSSGMSMARHGRMFLTSHRLCFHSGVLGTFKVALDYDALRAVRSENPIQSWIPNALTVITKSENYFFSQFISTRDQAYDLICALWLSFSARVQKNTSGDYKPKPNSTVDVFLDEKELPYEEPVIPIPLHDPAADSSPLLDSDSPQVASPTPQLVVVQEADLPPSSSSDVQPSHTASKDVIRRSSRLSNANNTSAALTKRTSFATTASSVNSSQLKLSRPILQRTLSPISTQRGSSPVPRLSRQGSVWASSAHIQRSEPRRNTQSFLQSLTRNHYLLSAFGVLLFVLLVSYLWSDESSNQFSILPIHFTADERKSLLATHLAEIQQYVTLQRTTRDLKHQVAELQKIHQILDLKKSLSKSR